MNVTLPLPWLPVFALGLSLSANVGAEVLLGMEMRRPYRSLNLRRRMLRLARWVACSLGFLLLACFNASAIVLIAFALFSVTASTDLETQRIPPDGFIYGAVSILIALAFITGGLTSLRDIVVAQAMCFVVMVLAVAFARAASPGDIKVLMQYGATCGSLPVVIGGLLAETVLRLGLLVCIIGRAMRMKDDRRGAITRGLHVRLPHAPVAWVGVLAALIAQGTGWI